MTTILPSGWTAIESPLAIPTAQTRPTRKQANAAPQLLPIIFITTVNSHLGTELRLHRSRRNPARPGQLALPRRRGRLFPGAGAGAGGLPPGRSRGRDHVRPPRAPGARGGAADGPDLLHLRGRLRLRDRGRDDADDRRDGTERGRDDLRADRAAGDSEAALRALRGTARVPLALAPRPRPLPPLPRQGRRRGGQRAPARAWLRRPAAA